MMHMSSPSNVIDLANRITAVSDATATSTPCGAVVFWALSGDTTVQKITDALAAEQSSASPPDAPSEKLSRHRACEAVARAQGLNVEIIKRGPKRSRAGVYAITRPLAFVEGDPMVSKGDELRASVVAMAGADGFTGDDDTCASLRAQLVIQRETLTASDVSSWLAKRLVGLSAISLRPDGGVYFVPSESMPRFKKVCAALAKSTDHRAFTIPALKSNDAVEAILAALEADTTRAIDALTAKIAKGDLGQRALDTVETNLEGLTARLSSYEKMLGRKLDSVREKAAEAGKATATAMLAALADDDEDSDSASV